MIAALIAAAAVSLGQAHTPPTEMAYLWPHSHVTYDVDGDGHNCWSHGGSFFTDVQAYRWDGTGFARQRRLQYEDLWQRGALKVTFDGRTFTNHSRVRVLIAGWCG